MKFITLHQLIALFIFIVFQLGAKHVSAQSDSVKVIYEFADEMPVFPGGEKALTRFFDSTIKYPEAAFDNNIQGTVYLSMRIDKEGNAREIKILRDIGGGCGKEALRAAGLMPKWTPGKQNGKAVDVKINMPVKFMITGGGSKSKKKRKKN